MRQCTDCGRTAAIGALLCDPKKFPDQIMNGINTVHCPKHSKRKVITFKIKKYLEKTFVKLFGL